MRLISDHIVSCASCDCGKLDLFLNSLDWDFDFASLCGTALAASVLRCLFSVGQLEPTTLALTRI